MLEQAKVSRERKVRASIAHEKRNSICTGVRTRLSGLEDGLEDASAPSLLTSSASAKSCRSSRLGAVAPQCNDARGPCSGRSGLEGSSNPIAEASEVVEEEEEAWEEEGDEDPSGNEMDQHSSVKRPATRGGAPSVCRDGAGEEAGGVQSGRATVVASLPAEATWCERDVNQLRNPTSTDSTATTAATCATTAHATVARPATSVSSASASAVNAALTARPTPCAHVVPAHAPPTNPLFGFRIFNSGRRGSAPPLGVRRRGSAPDIGRGAPGNLADDDAARQALLHEMRRDKARWAEELATDARRWQELSTESGDSQLSYAEMARKRCSVSAISGPLAAAAPSPRPPSDALPCAAQPPLPQTAMVMLEQIMATLAGLSDKVDALERAHGREHSHSAASHPCCSSV